jgi:hypothetical protein
MVTRYEIGHIYMARFNGISINGKKLYKIGKSTRPWERLAYLLRQYKLDMDLVALSPLIDNISDIERIVLVFYAGGCSNDIINGIMRCGCQEIALMDDITANKAISDISNLGRSKPCEALL